MACRATTSLTRGGAALAAALLALSVAACADDTRGMSPVRRNDAGDAALATDAGGDAPLADGGAAGTPGTDAADGGSDVTGPAQPAPPAPRGVMVLGSNYTTTTVSLLDATGTLVKDGCISSTTVDGKLSASLSGDVSLPSQPQRGNELWLLDRGNTALTVVDPDGCAVKRQFTIGNGTAFRYNPHDVAVVSAAKAYVTRFETNKLAAQARDRGDDLLIVDPQTGAQLGRVDLAPYAAANVQARPDRAVLARGLLFVTTGQIDASFVTSAEAKLIVVDPATDAVKAAVALSGLKSCSAMDVLPGGDTLYVACSGAFAERDQTLQSGVALIDLTADPPVVSRVISSQLFKSRPVNFSWVVVAAPTQAFAGVLGAFAAGSAPALPDLAYAFDPLGGTTAMLLSAGAYDLGRAAGGGGRLFVPEGNGTRPRLHVFATPAAAPATETASFDPAPATHLPPREVAWY